MQLRFAMLLVFSLLAGCDRKPNAPAAAGEVEDARTGQVTVGEESPGTAPLHWEPALSELAPEQLAEARKQARQALKEGRLYEDGSAAIPLCLSILRLEPGDEMAQSCLQQARAAVLVQGGRALAGIDRGADVLDESYAETRRLAAVARRLWPEDAGVQDYLSKVDVAEQVRELNLQGEQQLEDDGLGEDGGRGALGSFRAALALDPANSRAWQGLAATESAMIRRAEDAAHEGNFELAARWIAHAAKVRDDAGQTIADARGRVDAIRRARIQRLHDEGVATVSTAKGLAPPAMRKVREQLAEVLRIADPGDPVAADFRRRVDLATHYGLYRPGQAFTDALAGGGRGPEMIVVPHGAFRMGAEPDEIGSSDAEKPAHYIRFDRGFAMSRRAVTVAEFRRFVEATGKRPRATRRGHSLVYDERSGNFVRRSGVDWQSAYDGSKAADDQPVLHVSVHDAEAYAEWLSQQTGVGYRLPSEAEYEYALRAGRTGRYPWGDEGTPPRGFGNLAGGNDASPSGRRWQNAFVGYGDGWWGVAPGGRFQPNPWGLYDLGSNVSEWVADCWHASYRRAPSDGAAWFNPGCRSRVVRGGSWASSPAQSRAAWRSSTDSDMTSARVGFRVVRGI